MAAGYKDFTAGAVLTAADLEDYCERQGIMQFATSAARDAALTTAKTEGTFAYLIDSNTVTVYTGSAWSTIGPVHGALSTWTPAVVQSGSVTATVNFASYNRVGRMVTAFFTVSITGSGSASNLVTVSLPVTSDAAFVGDSGSLGVGYLSDASVPQKYDAVTVLASTTTLKFRSAAATNVFLGSATFTAALASGDVISGIITYPAGADA